MTSYYVHRNVARPYLQLHFLPLPTHPLARPQGRSRAAGGGAGVQPVPPELLKKYIAYARARCAPKMTDEAAEELVNRCVCVCEGAGERGTEC